jgi:hypothetical protein
MRLGMRREERTKASRSDIADQRAFMLTAPGSEIPATAIP